MKLGQYIGDQPTYTFNEATGLFEAKLEGAFNYVIPPCVFFGIFRDVKCAIAEFEACQKRQVRVVLFKKEGDG